MRGARVVVVACACLLAVLAGGARPTSVRAVDPEALTFAVIGDYGDAGPNEQAVANLVQHWDPAFTISTGDNNYPDGAATTIDHNVGHFYHAYIAPYVGAYGGGAEVNLFFPRTANMA